MIALLDGNLLVALVVADHVHHQRASDWFLDFTGTIATTPSTQGTLLRLLLRSGASAIEAFSVLDSITSIEHHEFWPDNFAYSSATLRNVTGHRQVTDAYLAAHVRARNARLITFDRGLSLVHPDVVDLLTP